jgi:hypothetical protein
MDAKHLRKFAEAMHRADSAEDGPALWVTVTYKGSTDQYDEWAPVRLEDMTENGIRDPGFGSGPIEYADVAAVIVHAVPRSPAGHVFSSESLEKYDRKYRSLLELTKNIGTVRIGEAEVAIR